jgi:hypothetical protein
MSEFCRYFFRDSCLAVGQRTTCRGFRETCEQPDKFMPEPVKKEIIPGYSVDKIGLYTETEEGRFRPIDIVDGNVVFMQYRPPMVDRVRSVRG